MALYTNQVVVDNVVPVTGPLTDVQLRATPVPISGTVSSTPASSSSSSVTSVASSATSVQLLASNGSRKAFSIYNESTSVLYLKLGTTASLTSYTLQIPTNSYYESQDLIYTGEVDGIWASANGSARITELS
jgi:hypothetical protein